MMKINNYKIKKKMNKFKKLKKNHLMMINRNLIKINKQNIYKENYIILKVSKN